MKNRCFIYCRQSSGQDDAGASVSIQQQIRNCLDCAERHHLTVADVFTDANVSGKTYPAGPHFEQIAAADPGFKAWYSQQSGVKKFRTGLGALMARLDEVGTIVVDEVTRLHRAPKCSFLEQSLTFEITRARVKILQVKGGELDLSRFDQNLIQILRTQINDEQISNQKKKSMESRARIRDSGILAQAKFFAGVYDGNKKFHFDPQKIKTVQRLFRAFADGVPERRIICAVNRESLAEFAPARMFYGTTLRRILTNPVYAGMMRDSAGELIPCRNAPDPPVPPLLFEAVQRRLEHKRLSGRRDGRKRILPLTGFLHCGSCGGKMSVTLDRGRIFYRCIGGDYAGQCGCRRSRVYAADEEGGLLGAVKPLLLIALLRRIGNLEDRLAAGARESAERELAHVREKLRSAFDLFQQDILDEESYRESTVCAMERKRMLQKELRLLAAATGEDTAGELEALRKKLKDFLCSGGRMPDGDAAELIPDALQRIDCFADHVCIQTQWGDFSLPRIALDGRRHNVFPVPELQCRDGTWEIVFKGRRMDDGPSEILAKWEKLEVKFQKISQPSRNFLEI